jgi:hypothetical protein
MKHPAVSSAEGMGLRQHEILAKHLSAATSDRFLVPLPHHPALLSPIESNATMTEYRREFLVSFETIITTVSMDF